jgi:hypothetical protein
VSRRLDSLALLLLRLALTIQAIQDRIDEDE